MLNVCANVAFGFVWMYFSYTFSCRFDSMLFRPRTCTSHTCALWDGQRVREMERRRSGKERREQFPTHLTPGMYLYINIHTYVCMYIACRLVNWQQISVDGCFGYFHFFYLFFLLSYPQVPGWILPYVKFSSQKLHTFVQIISSSMWQKVNLKMSPLPPVERDSATNCAADNFCLNKCNNNYIKLNEKVMRV